MRNQLEGLMNEEEQGRHDRILELTEELENLTIEQLLSRRTRPIGYLDALTRVTSFVAAMIERIMVKLANRVYERWPEEMKEAERKRDAILPPIDPNDLN